MPNSTKEVLLIIRNLAEADLIRKLLLEVPEGKFLVFHEQSLDEGLKQLRNRTYDLVLADLAFPDSQGSKTALAVRHEADRTPVIVLVTRENEETAKQVMRMDIQDYLVKEEITGSLVTRSIRGAFSQKELAEALRDSEERFHATFDQAAVGIGHVAPDGSWLRINRKYCDIVGYTEEEMKSLTIDDITHPDDLEITRKHFCELLGRERDSYSLEKRYVRKDGSTVWVNLTASVVVDADDNLKFLVGFVEDITSRIRAEEDLRFSEARYKALFLDNPTMITTIDRGLTMLSVNPFCARQLGYTIEELEGRSVLDIFYPDDRPAVVEQLLKCLQNPEKVFRWQFRKVRKDGGLIFVEEIAQAVHDRDNALNILVVCQDITDRKRWEEEIEKLNNELSMRAAELQAANTELEAFNYTVAHDLRKPLTVLNLLCQRIQELCAFKLGPECADYLQESYETTLRMNQLIDSLLDFSQLGRVQPRQEKVNLSVLAQAVAEELKKSLPERRITFRIAKGIFVEGDVELLRVVLDNLLDNACKHTAIREEAVIDFGRVNIEGVQACFVRDNGTGFDMADADKLFHPFQSLPGTEQFRGFGIGLATVERIIRRHGGKVWAEGRPGKGATFYFTLRFRQEG